MSRFIIWGLALIAIVGINIAVIRFDFIVETAPYIVKSADVAPEAQVALVLGSSVSNSSLMPVALDRADTAIELYKAKKIKKILVSGDNSTRSYNEVVPVRAYLLSKGIPENSIILDYAGFDTYDSMYRAVHIFGIKSALVVTQSFHLNRALYIARSLGLEAHGVPADKREYLYKNTVREWFASIKALYEVVHGTQPKILGRKIIIEDL